APGSAAQHGPQPQRAQSSAGQARGPWSHHPSPGSGGPARRPCRPHRGGGGAARGGGEDERRDHPRRLLRNDRRRRRGRLRARERDPADPAGPGIAGSAAPLDTDADLWDCCACNKKHASAGPDDSPGRDCKGAVGMPKTQPEPIRDPRADRLLPPDNCVVALIDFQPRQCQTVTSATKERIDLTVVAAAKAGAAAEVPGVLAPAGVDRGVRQGTEPATVDEPPGIGAIDRTGVGAWEGEDFRSAIEATARKSVVSAGPWTEVCRTFPTLGMLAE